MKPIANKEICNDPCYDYCKERRREEVNKKRIIIFIVVVIVFIIVIIIGTVGYVYLFELSWIDAFYNASLILTAISVEVEPQTTGQKLFIIAYSLVSVILLISIANSIMELILNMVTGK